LLRLQRTCLHKPCVLSRELLRLILLLLELMRSVHLLLGVVVSLGGVLLLRRRLRIAEWRLLCVALLRNEVLVLWVAEHLLLVQLLVRLLVRLLRR
jgi:hypothetical protein